MKNMQIVEPYKVFKKTKPILDAMKTDLERRMFLRNIYRDTAKVRKEQSATDPMVDHFNRWATELDKEIYAGLKGIKLPLFIETY